MKKKIHFSIDDVINVFRLIKIKKPKDIFEMEFFATLKRWNELYNIRTTLYIYEQMEGFSITETPKEYFHIFRQSSDWLKFGYHGVSPQITKPLDEDFYKSFNHVEEFICNMMGKEAWSNILRLHNWYATNNQVKFLEDKGIKILLTSDENKNCYNQGNNDENQKIIFRKTDIRFEKFNSSNEIIGQIKNKDNLVLFTHEWCFVENTNKIEEVFKYGGDYESYNTSGR